MPPSQWLRVEWFVWRSKVPVFFLILLETSFCLAMYKSASKILPFWVPFWKTFNFFFLFMFSRSHKLMWLRGLVWNSRRDFFFKYILSTTCLAIFSSGFTLVYSFSEVPKSTWFSAKSKTSRYLHLSTLYCNSAGKKTCERRETAIVSHTDTRVEPLHHMVIHPPPG